mmetsp:Transcript_31774/g.77560  ORF Transcript_31774/g.77560 Transcript_31774/m.77560 type:complete len:114 (-) Transcript_31774:130-471(-)|eukprot:CAMPEP_0114142076 /NCGR_PEP_ID=MMETSP0043_2-20121206/18255_1 /TAXON_ID=464988 /ORGANISM="Hemiselmis andersenii, Strain CCMP644" /LENGTH=113 /DNA_ID=CAMNT_0001236273 /DNA_START=22 /DNA_END=363 /DNA_ORIENTATION=-
MNALRVALLAVLALCAAQQAAAGGTNAMAKHTRFGSGGAFGGNLIQKASGTPELRSAKPSGKNLREKSGSDDSVRAVVGSKACGFVPQGLDGLQEKVIGCVGVVLLGASFTLP